MNTNQKGFTLVELVVVIVILGILAATALPRFINLTTQAHEASLDALVGALNSASSLCQAKWTASGASGTVCAMVGQNVDVSSTTGIPDATATGIVVALSANTGFAAPTCAAGVCTWSLLGTTAGTCTSTYAQATGTGARGTITGC